MMYEVVNARITPDGRLDVLAKAEVSNLLDASRSGLYEIFRNCSLAVLNCGSCLDDGKELLERYKTFDISLIQQARGVKLEVKNAPANAFVDFSFTLQFDASLPGLTQAAQVKITGNRDTLTSGSGTMRLAYEGVTFNATYSLNETSGGTITITNQDNVTTCASEVVKKMDYEHVAIIDDVVTTTSTVNELSRVLKRAGVKKVSVYSIARAPLK